MRRRQPAFDVWMPAMAMIAASIASGCTATGSSPSCRVGADCASGVCTSEGSCLPVMGEDGSTPDDAGTDATTTDDAGADPDGATADADTTFDDGGVPGCAPNHDGVIERSEMPIMAGLRATYEVARGVTVDTAGEATGDGERRWDFTGPYEGDRSVLVEAEPLEGTWYAEDFPAADYTTLLNARDNLLGVFEITPDELLLRGVVSPEEGFDRYNLEHDPPVPLLDFPLEAGASWTSESDVTGVTFGTPTTHDEVYSMNVDATGTLVTPFGEFEVLRVSSVLERTVGLVTTTVRTFLFVTECFGTVATVVSEDNESREEFTDAAEIRRLAP